MSDTLLSELSNADIDWLVSAGQQEQIAAGSRLDIQQHLKGYFLVVLDGELSVSLAAGEPISQGVMRLSAGSVIGEADLFELGYSALTWTAAEDSIVLKIPMAPLQKKLRDDREFAAHFYRAIALIMSEQIEKLLETPGQFHMGVNQPARDGLFVFGELRDSDLDWLVSAGQVRRLEPEEFLLRVGRPVDALHIVLDGLFSVSTLEGQTNALAVCFDCQVKTASTLTVVNTLGKGEVAGAIAFLDFRPLPVAIRAERESLVLSVPRQQFALKLQQDLGFASRFHKIMGTQLAGTLKNMVESLTGASPGVSQPGADGLDEDLEFTDELDLDALQKMSNGANRFNWMLSRLGVGVS